MKTNKKYIDSFKEWQDHQYDPGYYTGGKIPPSMTDPGKPALWGWILLFQAVICLPAATVLFIWLCGQLKEDIIMQISIFLVIYILSFASLIAGFRLIKKSKYMKGKHKKSKHWRELKKAQMKKLSLILGSILIIVLIISFLLTKQTTITINDPNDIHIQIQYSINHNINDTKCKLILYDGTTLHCTDLECREIEAIESADKPFSIAIKYRWNVLTPQKGRVLDIYAVNP